MGDSIVMILAIVIGAILMVAYPLLVTAENSERVSQMAVQTIVSEFVDSVTTLGKIRETDYEHMRNMLSATGNSFEVNIEVRHVDENTARIGVHEENMSIGGNTSFSVFNSTIFGGIDNSRRGNFPGYYLLKRDDTIIVSVRNTNRNIAQLLRDSMFSIMGSGHQVGAIFTGRVVNNGRV